MLDASGIREGDTFGEEPSGANLAGVIWGPQLADATGDRRWADLLVQAAGHYESPSPGDAPPPADPDFRTEDIFMCGAILGRAFRVTGEDRYLDLLVRFLLDLGTQQENGLFWHCRSAPYFWGRANGFAAIGLAESLNYLPGGHPKREAILNMYLAHMDAMCRLQQPSGMFPQVLDVPGSYQEFTSTSMFGYAAARGLRRGWLDSSVLEPMQLAWQGVSERIDDRGSVVDACANTGVQGSLRDYLDRPAVSGFDDRSGGFALWFAVEQERLAQDNPV
jgi:rhamnogalacturonyl hydrolase YesR